MMLCLREGDSLIEYQYSRRGSILYINRPPPGTFPARLFEEFFGFTGSNINSIFIDGEEHSGYTVLTVGRRYAKVFLDFIDNITYDGLLDRIHLLGTMLSERSRTIPEVQVRKSNDWLRGSYADCSICLSKTFSRFSCGHHVCGTCFGQMIQHTHPGGFVKCPECRLHVDGKGVCLHGDDLAVHISCVNKTFDSKDQIIRELRQEVSDLRNEAIRMHVYPIYSAIKMLLAGIRNGMRLL